MFGLDESLAQLGDGEVFGAVILVARPARAAARHRSRPPRRGHHARRGRPGRRPPGPAARASPGASATPPRCSCSASRSCVCRAYLPERGCRRRPRPRRARDHRPGGPAARRWRARRSAARARASLQAYGIGLVHGMGGTAGVGVLLLAGIPDHIEAVAALGGVRPVHGGEHGARVGDGRLRALARRRAAGYVDDRARARRAQPRVRRLVLARRAGRRAVRVLIQRSSAGNGRAGRPAGPGRARRPRRAVRRDEHRVAVDLGRPRGGRRRARRGARARPRAPPRRPAGRRGSPSAAGRSAASARASAASARLSGARPDAGVPEQLGGAAAQAARHDRAEVGVGEHAGDHLHAAAGRRPRAVGTP